MRQIWKRTLAWFATGILLFSAAAAENQEADEIILGGETERPETNETWHFDGKGFLIGENPGESYLLEDEENGIWQYATADLSIRITRFEEPAGNRISHLYCVAEVYASERSPLFTIMTPGNEKRPGGYFPFVLPEKLVRDNPVMLAMSDDYYGYRQYRRDLKKATWPPGIILRNGEIFYTLTRDSSKKRNFPPMDTLAVYPDGSMKVRICDELTAEEYLADGATQVFSFGPWLIRDGQANEDVLHPKKNDIMKNSNPRAVMGMVEPFHYILMVVGVPNENRYVGVSGEWLINKLLEYGCTEALNLDGGGTACMIFNGKTIIQGRWVKEKRVLGSMIAFGDLQQAQQKDSEE